MESLQRWQQHFNSVLNTTSVFSFDSFPSSNVHSELADVPSLDENRNALSLIAGNKNGGINGILSEMVKVCSDELLSYLLDLLLLFGIVEVFPRSGEMSLWFLCLRREICHHVITGVGSAYLMSWVRFLQRLSNNACRQSWERWWLIYSVAFVVIVDALI